MKLTNDQVEKAVDWWSKFVANAGIDPTQFVGQLRSHLRGPDFGRYGLVLASDYGAMDDLLEVATKCGIHWEVFPTKAKMYFENGKVTVSYGYGAEEVEI